MRVLILSGTFSEKADGVARTLFRLSDTYSRAGIDHWVYAPVTDPLSAPHLTIGKVRSMPVPFYRDYRISLPGKQLEKEWDAIKPDIVHIATPDLLGKFGLSYAEKRNIPVVAVYHTHFPAYLDYYYTAPLKPLLIRYLRRFYQRCHVVFAPSKAMCDMLSVWGVDDVRLWQRGIEGDVFNSGQRDERLREQWQATDKFVVTFAGRLVWYKDVADFRAVYLELKDDERFRFVMVGDGPAAADLRKTMHNAVFTGLLNKQEVGQALASSDIMLFPSRTETFGQVVLEGMACGLPVIVCDQGGPQEIVSNADAGIVVETGNQKAFVQAVQKLADDKKFYETCRQKAYKYTKDLSWQAINQRVIDTYTELKSKQSA